MSNFNLMLSPGKVDSCKPDCPERSSVCHCDCPRYAEAKRKAAAINEKYRLEMEIDSAISGIAAKNKEKFRGMK